MSNEGSEKPHVVSILSFSDSATFKSIGNTVFCSHSKEICLDDGQRGKHFEKFHKKKKLSNITGLRPR